MGGCLLDVDCERRRRPAKAGRSRAQLVDGVKQLVFELRVKGVGVVDAMGRSKARLASEATWSKLPPMPTPTMMGGHGLGPACRTASSTNARTPVDAIRGLEHLELPHVL